MIVLTVNTHFIALINGSYFGRITLEMFVLIFFLVLQSFKDISV